MDSDFTTEILALQRAKVDMQTEKATNKITVKARYAERIRQDVADADEAAELRFARMLADAVAAGVPQSLIRREVLRTNTWSRWTYWRDLAGIEPERVTLRNAKEAAKAEAEKDALSFEWVDGLLRWYRHPETGEKLNHELVIRYRDRYGAYWGPHQYSDAATRDDVVGSLTYGLSGGGYALYKAVKDEVLTNGGDLPDAAEDLETADLETVADNPWMENMK